MTNSTNPTSDHIPSTGRPKGHTKSASTSGTARVTDLPPLTTDGDYRPP